MSARKAAKAKRTPAQKTDKGVSPWRLCPGTEYWRNEHIQGSYTKADGTFVRAHEVSGCCCRRPSGKDQIYADEMKEIAEKHFTSVKERSNKLPVKKPWAPNDPNTFDNYYAGWTKYWNDVFNSKNPLDPNLVKALAGSESMFNPNPGDVRLKNGNYARGLFQLTDETRDWLSNEKLGEIKDHFVHLDGVDVYDPNFSTCAAVRWLFRKRDLATSYLKRQASWEEAIENYKGVLDKSQATKTRVLKRFNEILKELKNQ